MRLIEEAEAIKNIEQFCDIPRYAKDEAEQIIRETNTVDAVPVVRCYECRKYHTPDCHAGHEQAAADYCSHGIRKDGKK